MTLLLPLALFAPLLLQQDPATLRVDVNLVQVDAVVKDRQGRQVTNLTKDDFELLEGGKLRAITNFSYVRVVPGPGGPSSVANPATVGPGGVRQLRRDQIQRTIALVVDDLRMSFTSVHETRLALHKFLDQQMIAGDLVAIVPASGGVSALQRFTTDKRILHAAVDRIRFQLSPGMDTQETPLRQFNGQQDSPLGSMLSRRYTVGTLGTLRYVVEGMRSLPGRKAVMLFSDGFTLYRSPRERQPPVTAGEARTVTDAANLGGVVIYGADPRGLIVPGLKAEDDVQEMEPEQVIEALNSRSTKLGNNQDGIRFLAGETGGIAHYNDNDLNTALGRMLDDQAGYYLIGFSKEGDGDGGPALRRVTLRLKNHGSEFRLRYRRSASVPSPGGAGAVAATATPAAKLLAALNSPFSGDTSIGLRLTPAFVATASGQPAIRALLHIQAPNLAFGEPDPEGYRRASLRVLGITEPGGGTTERNFTIRVKDDPQAIGNARANGWVYAFEHEVRKSGPYFLRVAVMDGGTLETGSAGQYVEVPDLRKGQPTASGLSMMSGDARQASGEGEDLSAAVRIFGRDQTFSYGWMIYHPKAGLTMHPRLVRDGQVVWSGKAVAIPAAGSAGGPRVPAGGVLRLGAKTDPGSYLLEVQLLDGARLIAERWIDFDLR